MGTMMCCQQGDSPTNKPEGEIPHRPEHDFNEVPETYVEIQADPLFQSRSEGSTPWVSKRRFKRLHSLGKGCEGEVFLATLDGQRIAAKRLDIVANHAEYGLVTHEQVTTLSKLHGSMIYQAVTEATTLRDLEDHMNIAKFLGFVEGTVCGVRVPEDILMEYIPGGTLADALKKKKKKLSDLEFVNIDCDVLAGLAHLQKNSVVHRDIKPTNLMYDENHRVKIVDFGFAKRLSDSGSVSYLRGTWCYTAPELIDQHDADPERSTRPNPSADMYSWGMTAFELLGLKAELRAEDPGYNTKAAEIAARFPIMGTGLLSCIETESSQRRSASELLEETHSELRRLLGHGQQELDI